MTTHHVPTEHGDLAYIDEGSGPAALFLHGVFLNSHLWRNAIDALRTERRCLAIDRPAHGATRLTPGHDLSLPALAEVLDAFCAALDLDAVDLVANDTG